MTSEIALMNRRAVALAADSATTVQYFERGERKQRYFKGTNKIFNLSSQAPIALMTFDSGNLHGVPWETIAKLYRTHLGDTKRDHLSEYAPDFFKFLETNRDLYAENFLEQQFLSDISEQADLAVYMMTGDDEEGDAEKRKAQMQSGLSKVRDQVKRFSFIGDASQATVDALLGKYRDKIIEVVQTNEYAMTATEVVPIEEFAALIVETLLKTPSSILETSGLVIAGFGEKEHFPALEQYVCYGFIMGKPLCEQVQVKAINQQNVAEILPFAQSEMSKGFVFGAQPSVLDTVHKSLAKCLDDCEDLLQKGCHIKADTSLDEIKRKVTEQFKLRIARELATSHTRPMKRVVGVLPLDELAELAEILVRIESLKERVTRESESVSGPIDVAVISKGDGFIWIKRKHYFEPKLNPRFLARTGATAHHE